MSDAAEASSFWIDRDNLCLRRSHAGGEDERVRLMPKTFDVLAYLAANPGRLVTHDELLDALWPGVHVQPEVLKSHILAIRTALGDTISSPRFIETQRGRGYRFIARMRAGPSLTGRPEPAADLGVFAGRAEPMQRLMVLLDRAAAGNLQAAFISGEPGIGKTTLVQQFLARASAHADFVVARGHCMETFASAEPYYPIFEAFGELCRDTGTGVVRAFEALAPSWAAQMPAQFSAAQRIALQQQMMPGAPSRMVREACSLLEALAVERPLILALEDLHWADFATLDLISALCRRRSSAKLLLIATYRTGDPTAAQRPLRHMTQDLALHMFSTDIELDPLSMAAITEILSGSAGDGAHSSELGQFIKQRTGGNPLSMRAVLDHLLHRGDIERAGRGWRSLVPLSTLASETPPTLGRVIETNLERMTRAQQRVLEAASVAGDPFDGASAAGAAEVDELSFEAVCDDLPSCTIRPGELLRLPGGKLVRTYAFSHAIYRQVVYDRIGQARRAQLHRVIGERLEEIYPLDRRDEVATRLAQHFAQAGDWSRALDYLRSALRIAYGRFAWRDALVLLDGALDLAVHLTDAARVAAEIELLEWRAAIESAGHDPGAQETYAQLADRAGRSGDVDAQCRALIGLSNVLGWHDMGRSLRVLDEVLSVCEKQSDPVQQDFTRITAYVQRLWQAGWNQADSQRCEEALARLRVSGDRLTLARANGVFSLLCLVSTRYQDARDLLEDSHRVLTKAPQTLAEAHLARIAWVRHVAVMPWALLSLGEFGLARKEFAAGIEILEKSGEASAVRSLQIYRSVLLFHALDFENVLQACVPVANPPLAEGGDASRVLPVDRRMALILCGLAEAGLGNRAAASDYLRTAEAEFERQPVHLDWYWRVVLGWGTVNLLLSEGNHPAALAHAERLCELAAQTDERAWQALAWEARARADLACGATARAIRHVASALAACEAAKVPLAEWRVHATAAMAFKAAGNSGQARTHSRLGAAIRGRLAGTLPEGDPLRSTFERRGGLATVRASPGAPRRAR